LTCAAERVTGFVDGELDADAAAAVAAHLTSCATCRAQAEDERALRARLRELPAPDLPPGLEERVRQRVRRRSPSALARASWALPLAAALLAAFWIRSHAPFVAWELARDHDHCFSRARLPARVWSDEPAVVEEWFARQKTRMPQLPAGANGLALVGARYCPLPDASMAPHVYYSSGTSRLSVFLVPHAVRLEGRFAGAPRGRSVRLLRVGSAVVGIVGEREGEVQAFESALRPAIAARWGR
jgi:anti-sigma factor RsiW